MSTFRRRSRALAYVMSLVFLAAVTWFPTRALAQLVPGGGGFGGGSSGTANPVLNTTQTPDTLYLSTDPLGNSLIIGEAADSGFDFAHALATDPLLVVHSHNQSTTQWLSFVHNGTRGIINDGTGTGIIIGSGSATGVNGMAIGASLARMGSAVQFGWSSTTDPGVAADTVLTRKAAATVQMGLDANGAVTAQRFQGANGITGTDIAAGNISFGGQVGTGAGAGAQSGIDRALMRATGTTAQVNGPAIYACESKTLSNTTATTTALATVALASNSAGSVRITASVTCDDGTNFDSDVITSYVAFVNKATVITFGTPVTTASAAANNSGSCTVAPTFTAGSSLINVNVTPVITTIVPTTTTAYLNIETFGAGAVSCK